MKWNALLVAALVLPHTAAGVTRPEDPPIRLWLNQDGYYWPGDRARVTVKLANDGYLVVLRADEDGRVRVLFPRDPSDDAFAPGRKKFEIRGRGDRAAFFVDERDRSGVVLAAVSETPFTFNDFARTDHWDYRVLRTDRADDEETALVDIVQRMTQNVHFDYDVIRYTVATRGPHGRYYPRYSPVHVRLSFGWGWPTSRFGIGLGIGSCFDAIWYGPYWCTGYYQPYWHRPFASSRALWYRPFWPRPAPVWGAWPFWTPRRASSVGFRTRTVAPTNRSGPRFRLPDPLRPATRSATVAPLRGPAPSRARVAAPQRVGRRTAATPRSHPSLHRDGSHGVDRSTTRRGTAHGGRSAPARRRQPSHNQAGRSAGGRRRR